MKPHNYFKSRSLFHWEYCNYYKLLLVYANLLGKRNILIIPQEKLLRHEQDVINDLAGFMGINVYDRGQKRKRKKNVSLSSQSLSLLRIINHFTASYYKPSNLISNKITTWKFRKLLEKLDPLIISKLSQDDNIIPDGIIEKAKTYYRESNKKLSHKFNLELGRYGYF